MTFQPAFAACGFLLNYVPYNIFRLEFLSIPACWSAFPFIIYFILILNSTEGRALYRLPLKHAAGHPLLTLYLQYPSSTSSKSPLPPPHPAALHTAPYTQNPSLGTFPFLPSLPLSHRHTAAAKEDIYALWLYAAHSVLPVNGTTHVLAKNKLPDLISGSLVYCFRIPVGRSSDHGSSFSK